MMDSMIPAVCEHVVVTEFDGGEGVLIDLNAKRYYQLNETALLVWRGLERGSSFREIVAAMTEGYEVTAERAAVSLERVMADFAARALVRGN